MNTMQKSGEIQFDTKKINSWVKPRGSPNIFALFFTGTLLSISVREILRERKKEELLTHYRIQLLSLNTIRITILNIRTRYTWDSIFYGISPRSDDAPLCVDSRDPLFRIPSILLVLVNQASEGQVARGRAPENVSSSGKCCR